MHHCTVFVHNHGTYIWQDLRLGHILSILHLWLNWLQPWESDDLTGDIGPHVGHPRDLVRHDRLPPRDGEEELVLHADVDADQDEVRDDVVDEPETKPERVILSCHGFPF